MLARGEDQLSGALRVEVGDLGEVVHGLFGQVLARVDAVTGEFGRQLLVHALDVEQVVSRAELLVLAVPDAALVDLVVAKYAPLPSRSLGSYLSLLSGGVPQWRSKRADALARARLRLGRTLVGSEDWYWPTDENPASRRWRPDERVRLLTPFDPIVHDRQRFERLWGWRYRFEAYTPPAKRKLGYYALPILWGDRVVGWGNLSVADGKLRSEFGYVDGRASAEAGFQKELAAELERMRVFLGGRDG